MQTSVPGIILSYAWVTGNGGATSDPISHQNGVNISASGNVIVGDINIYAGYNNGVAGGSGAGGNAYVSAGNTVLC